MILPSRTHFWTLLEHLGRTFINFSLQYVEYFFRASFGLFGWLTCGNAKAYLRPKSGKQDRTVQMPLFHVVYGTEQGVRSGPELKSMLPRLGQFWFILFIVMADMRPSYGLLGRSRPAQVSSFFTVCGLEQSVGSGLDMGQN